MQSPCSYAHGGPDEPSANRHEQPSTSSGWAGNGYEATLHKPWELSKRFRYANGESGRYYVWISRRMSLSIRASTSSSLSATSSATMSSS